MMCSIPLDMNPDQPKRVLSSPKYALYKSLTRILIIGIILHTLFFSYVTIELDLSADGYYELTPLNMTISGLSGHIYLQVPTYIYMLYGFVNILNSIDMDSIITDYRNPAHPVHVRYPTEVAPVE